MIYNRETGLALTRKYLDNEKWQHKLHHSCWVGNLSYSIAQKIQQQGININPEYVGFLAYVHDIGYVKAFFGHELHTIKLLQTEKIPQNIAEMTMHGQLYEEFANQENRNYYLPRGLEGKILTLADMCVRTGPVITIEERIADIAERSKKNKKMSDERKTKGMQCLHQAYPRFKSYEAEIFSLAKIKTIHDVDVIRYGEQLESVDLGRNAPITK